MARDYAIVTPRFWTGDTGRRLRGQPREQLVAAYLLTSPSANMIGLYYLPIPTLAHEVGITHEGALEALRRLSEEGFAYYDGDHEVVWVPEMGRHQVAPSMKAADNRVAGVVREALQYRKCRFYKDFVAHYHKAWNLPPMPPCEALGSPSEGPLEPLRSQDQDQDQDHDHSPTLPRARSREVSGPSRPTGSTGPDVAAEDVPREVERGQPGGSGPAARDGGDAAPAGIAGELSGAAGPAHLSPRELGALHRAQMGAPTPYLDTLLATLERQGFECGPPTKAELVRAMDREVGEVGVDEAARRVLARVTRERAARVIPNDTLGWYRDDICGRTSGGERAVKQSNPQVGVAAPRPAAAFRGGERELS